MASFKELARCKNCSHLRVCKGVQAVTAMLESLRNEYDVPRYITISINCNEFRGYSDPTEKLKTGSSNNDDGPKW